MRIVPQRGASLFRRLAGWVIFSSLCLYGQSTFGSLTGTVTDPSGAIIRGAVVEATNASTNVARNTITDADGLYRVVNLDPGQYSVTFKAPGFNTAEHKSVPVPARETVRIDVQLDIASGAVTTVDVSSSVSVSESLTQSDSKSGSEIGELALNFRATNAPSPIVVSNLAPGVQPDSTGNLSIAGQLPTATSFTLDGISTQQVRQGGPNKDMFPSVESIAEFRVNTAGNGAEYSQPTDITVVSKSGGNGLHGAGFGYMQRKNWNSPDALSGVIANGDANSYGATLSGPIWKNRTFFLFTYEGVRLDQNTGIVTTTPPTEWRNGDFSGSGQLLLNPLGGFAPFPNNSIPGAYLNPVSQKILSTFFPNPTIDLPSLSGPNFTQTFPGKYSNDGFDGRLDHNFGANHKVFFRVTNKQIDNAGTNLNPAYDPVLGTYTLGTDLANYTGSYNWIIKPNLVNEFRGGYTQANYTGSYPLARQGDSLIAGLGIAGLPGSPQSGLGGVPVFNFPTFFGGSTNPAGHPRDVKNGVLEFNDNITWIVGRHTLKAGAEFRKVNYQDSITFNQGDEYGDYYFTGAFTGGSSDANALGGMLLGLVDYATRAQNGPDGKPYGYHYGGFVQDELRILRNFTLTAGLRYEVNTPFNDETHQLGNFDPAYPGGRLIVQGQQGLALVSPAWRSQVQQAFNVPFVTNSQAGLPATLRNTYYGNIQPRLGLAWSIDEKTTFRAATGIYSVPVLGAVNYSLLGSNSSNYSEFISTPTAPLILPYLFSSQTTNPGYPDFRRANPFDLKDPRVIQWTAALDREIGHGNLVRLSYTGSHSYNLIYSPDINQVAPNTTGFGALTATPALRTQNLRYPAFNAVLTRANGLSAKYDAMTIEFNRRFAKGLTFGNSYSWSKNITNALGVAPNSNIGEGGQGDNGPNSNNWYDVASDFGNAPFTHRHRFVNTFTYELPLGRGQRFAATAGRSANLLIGGWRITGITLLQTGPYMTPYFTGGDPSGTNPQGRSVTEQRPDVVAGVSQTPSRQTAAQWFNAAAFSIPENNIGRFGNAGPGTLEGPSEAAFSMSVGKNFALTERIALRYEAQFANLFNVENYAAPNMQLNSGNFGQITSMQSVEQGGPRTIQMGLRLSF